MRAPLLVSPSYGYGYIAQSEVRETLMERLRTIYATAKDGYDAYCLLRSWCSMAEATEIPEVIAMAKTIRNHMKGILGYWKLGGLQMRQWKASTVRFDGLSSRLLDLETLNIFA